MTRDTRPPAAPPNRARVLALIAAVLLTPVAGGIGGWIMVSIDRPSGMFFGCIFAIPLGAAFALLSSLRRVSALVVLAAQFVGAVCSGLLCQHEVSGQMVAAFFGQALGGACGLFIADRFRKRPFPPGHCVACGYDLTGNVSGVPGVRTSTMNRFARILAWLRPAPEPRDHRAPGRSPEPAHLRAGAARARALRAAGRFTLGLTMLALLAWPLSHVRSLRLIAGGTELALDAGHIFLVTVNGTVYTNPGIHVGPPAIFREYGGERWTPGAEDHQWGHDPGFRFRHLPLYLLIGAGLLLGFTVSRFGAIRIPPGHCRKCGYNLTGNISGVCPECGVRI